MSMYDKNQYNIVNISLQLIKINEKKKKRKESCKKEWGTFLAIIREPGWGKIKWSQVFNYFIELYTL